MWLVIGGNVIHSHVDKAMQWYVLFQNTQLYSMFPHIFLAMFCILNMQEAISNFKVQEIP